MKKALSCPPFGDLPIEWSDGELNGSVDLAINAMLIEEFWPHIWPLIHSAIIEVVREYEQENYFDSAAKSLAICVSDLNADPDAEWTLTVCTEPFAGIYEVEMRGSKVLDASATF